MHEGAEPVTTWIALLRAVNVGGTGKLPMAVLKTMCDDAGFVGAQTYIASGNVVFGSALDEGGVRTALAERLEAYAGRRADVIVRTAAEIGSVVAANPFAERPGNRTVAVFFDEAPPERVAAHAVGRADEQIVVGRREVYVYYPGGMADSKLRFPAAKGATARNLNTVVALDALAGKVSGR